MENKKFDVNTTLSITGFLMLVDDLVDGFFTEDIMGSGAATYSPHIGRLNAMRLFYNLCIANDDYQIEHNVADPLVLENVFKDKEFLIAFNNAVYSFDSIDDDSFRERGLDFAEAYECAMQIVNYRKASPIAAIDVIKNGILQAIDKANDLLSADNIETIKTIMGNVNLDALTSGK